jgi:hypothetical protein
MWAMRALGGNAVDCRMIAVMNSDSTLSVLILHCFLTLHAGRGGSQNKDSLRLVRGFSL